MSITILLVEDNEYNRDMLTKRLKRQDYEVATAVDGQECLNSIASHAPDLVLMDMSLPVIDGWEATKCLKSDPKTKHIPIIALTAHAMLGDREKAMEAGCDDYAVKPIEFSNLLKKITKLLEQKKSENRDEYHD